MMKHFLAKERKKKNKSTWYEFKSARKVFLSKIPHPILIQFFSWLHTPPLEKIWITKKIARIEIPEKFNSLCSMS